MLSNFNVDLIVVGNLKEKAMKSLVDEYVKRLNGYIKLNIIELKDVSNKYQDKQVLEEEAKSILKVLDQRSYIIMCDLNKKELTSEQFADKLENIVTYENSKLTFIIGGSLGIDNQVKQLANYSLTFSKMTFPHQLFRVMFLEQLYRALRIKNNAPYHK